MTSAKAHVPPPSPQEVQRKLASASGPSTSPPKSSKVCRLIKHSRMQCSVINQRTALNQFPRYY